MIGGIDTDAIYPMDSVPEIIEGMAENPKDVRFADLCKVCDHYFGKSRQKGGRHRVYKTP